MLKTIKEIFIEKYELIILALSSSVNFKKRRWKMRERCNKQLF